MACAGCPGDVRIREHRAAVSVPQDRKPLPWPAEVADALSAGMKAHRLGLLKARAWLRTQPDDAHRAASLAQIVAWEQQQLQAERQIIRVGVARDA